MTHSARHEVKHREWDIGSVLLIGKRNLKGLVISLHPEALIRVGILEKIAGILAKRGISIILLRTNATRDYFDTLEEAKEHLCYFDGTKIKERVVFP